MNLKFVLFPSFYVVPESVLAKLLKMITHIFIASKKYLLSDI